MQLFFTVPVYITDWVDTTVLYNHLGFLTPVFGSIDGGVGVIRPEMMINPPAFSIIVFQILMSNALKNVKPVRSIVGGTFVVVIGVLQFAFYTHGGFFAMSLLIFAFGEMASSPRIQEYISSIAPPDKVGLYMGYSFLPVAGGNILGGFLSGRLYGAMADRYAYIPLVGISIAVSWGIGEHPFVAARRRAARAVAASVLIALGCATANQLRDWQTGVTLFEQIGSQHV